METSVSPISGSCVLTLALVFVAASFLVSQGSAGTDVSGKEDDRHVGTLHENQISRRLGHVFNPEWWSGLEKIDLAEPTAEVIDGLWLAVLRHGVVVVKNVTLSADELVSFTRSFGCEVIHLPVACGGSGLTGELPKEVTRISNYHLNGTWKGEHQQFGEYWHNDGDFWPKGQNHIMSLLHAHKVDQPTPTHFADTTTASAHFPAEMRAALEQGSILVNARDIPDFKPLFDMDLDMELKDQTHEHPILHKHPVTGQESFYFGWKHAQTSGLPTDRAATILEEALEITSQEKFVYSHSWEMGDLVLWDNISVIHKAAPIDHNDQRERTMLRTQMRGSVDGRAC